MFYPHKHTLTCHFIFNKEMSRRYRTPFHLVKELTLNPDLWRLISQQLTFLERLNLSKVCKETNRFVKIVVGRNEHVRVALLRLVPLTDELGVGGTLIYGSRPTDKESRIYQCVIENYFVKSIRLIVSVGSSKLSKQHRFEILLESSQSITDRKTTKIFLSARGGDNVSHFVPDGPFPGYRVMEDVIAFYLFVDSRGVRDVKEFSISSLKFDSDTPLGREFIGY